MDWTTGIGVAAIVCVAGAAFAAPLTEEDAKVLAETLEPGVAAVNEVGEDARVLSYTLEQGEVQRSVVRMGQKNTTIAGGMPVPTPALPVMAMTLDTSYARDAAAGGAVIESEFVSFVAEPAEGVPPMIIQMMEAQLGLFGDATLAVIRDERGAVSPGSAEVRGVTGVETSLLESVTQFAGEGYSAVFPAEPIGSGGSWDLLTLSDAGGVGLKVVTRYSIDSIDGDTIAISTTSYQFAEPGPISNPQLPPNVSVMLEALSGSSTGEMVCDLTKAMPVSRTVNGTTALKMQVTPGPGMPAQNISQTIETMLEIAPAPEGGAEEAPAEGSGMGDGMGGMGG